MYLCARLGGWPLSATILMPLLSQPFMYIASMSFSTYSIEIHKLIFLPIAYLYAYMRMYVCVLYACMHMLSAMALLLYAVYSTYFVPWALLLHILCAAYSYTYILCAVYCRMLWAMSTAASHTVCCVALLFHAVYHCCFMHCMLCTATCWAMVTTTFTYRKPWALPLCSKGTAAS